jgi:sigma-E factor negative regulatory protein RseA
VGWAALNLNSANTDVAPGTLAQTSTKVPVVALQPAGLPRVEPVAAAPEHAPEHAHEYLLAHQGISPSTAMQGVTPYIRTVSTAGNGPGLR